MPREYPGVAGGGGANMAQPAQPPAAKLQVIAPQGAAPQPSADMIKKLKSFSNKFCSVLGPGSMLKSATYYAYVVTGTDTEERVGVTATSASIPGEVTVTVSQVAMESRARSEERVSAGEEAFSSESAISLEQLPLETPLRFGDGGKLSFQINGKRFTFDRTTLLPQMLSEVSSDMDAMVSMTYDRIKDRFSVIADSGGRNSAIEITNLVGNAFGKDGAFRIDTGFYANGQNTLARIDGFPVECESREYQHKGLLFFFNAVTGKEGVSFSVTRDYDSTVHAIQQFVDELCTLIAALKSDPDEPSLGALADELRDALLTQEGGTGGSIRSFGIIAEAQSTGQPLPIIDINRLKMNLKLNTEEIVALFSNNAEGTDMGVAHKVKECIGKYLSVCRTPPHDGTISGRTEGKLDEMIEDYRKRYSEMQSAALIMEHQREVISTLFDI